MKKTFLWRSTDWCGEDGWAFSVHLNGAGQHGHKTTEDALNRLDAVEDAGHHQFSFYTFHLIERFTPDNIGARAKLG